MHECFNNASRLLWNRTIFYTSWLGHERHLNTNATQFFKKRPFLHNYVFFLLSKQTRPLKIESYIVTDIRLCWMKSDCNFRELLLAWPSFYCELLNKSKGAITKIEGGGASQLFIIYLYFVFPEEIFQREHWISKVPCIKTSNKNIYNKNTGQI